MPVVACRRKIVLLASQPQPRECGSETMKVSWSITLAGAVVGGLMLGSYLSHPDRAPVLRGYKIPLPELLQPSSSESDRQPGDSVVISEPEPPANLYPLPDSPDSPASIRRWNKEPTSVPALNLSLPELEWDDQGWAGDAAAYPDFFRQQQREERMSVSGRLHWDESEEAEALPITDTILGAEVELQLRLP